LLKAEREEPPPQAFYLNDEAAVVSVKMEKKSPGKKIDSYDGGVIADS
jgi:hypothetical protein